MNETVRLALDRLTRALAADEGAPYFPSGFKTFLDAMVKKEYNKPDFDGRYVLKRGDGGLARGPLQIHRVYWIDAQIMGRYEQVDSLRYATKTLVNYMLRYCPDALFRDDWETMARIHNGGPEGHKKASTLGYWRDVEKFMEAGQWAQPV